MTHAEQTAQGLTTWILGRIAAERLNPADLERTLLAALQDAEKRGAQLVSLDAPAEAWAIDVANEHVAAGKAEEAHPLNAHVGRRTPVVQAGGYFTIEDTAKGRTVDLSKREEAA